jgi:hypothetical protein
VRKGRRKLRLVLAGLAFIAAYMVGVNREFVKELLWGEYPTDQRGSPDSSDSADPAKE